MARIRIRTKALKHSGRKIVSLTAAKKAYSKHKRTKGPIASIENAPHGSKGDATRQWWQFIQDDKQAKRMAAKSAKANKPVKSSRRKVASNRKDVRDYTEIRNRQKDNQRKLDRAQKQYDKAAEKYKSLNSMKSIQDNLFKKQGGKLKLDAKRSKVLTNEHPNKLKKKVDFLKKKIAADEKKLIAIEKRTGMSPEGMKEAYVNQNLYKSRKPKFDANEPSTILPSVDKRKHGGDGSYGSDFYPNSSFHGRPQDRARKAEIMQSVVGQGEGAMGSVYNPGYNASMSRKMLSATDRKIDALPNPFEGQTAKIKLTKSKPTASTIRHERELKKLQNEIKTRQIYQTSADAVKKIKVKKSDAWKKAESLFDKPKVSKILPPIKTGVVDRKTGKRKDSKTGKLLRTHQMGFDG